MYQKLPLKILDKDELIDIILKKEKEINDKDKEIEDLKKELHKYKNSNTPPSANKHLQGNTQGKQAKAKSKQGAPKGHTGKTRAQTSDKKEIIDCSHCPECNSSNLKDEKIIKQTVEENPEPIVPETKEVTIHKKRCCDCGHVFIPPKNKTPLKGKFGINLMVLVVFIRFILRGVLRKTASFLDCGFMFKITPASINAIIKRVADAADKDFEKLKMTIRSSKIVYADESSFSVLGKKHWIWVFRTSTEILLVIRPSRGNNVLDEILDKYFTGTVICDCWGAYNFLEFAFIQRCWAHLLRKSKELSTVPGKHFHEKLKALFEEIKAFNECSHAQNERDIMYDIMTAKLTKLTGYYNQYDGLKKVIKYIDRRYDQWFTCIKIAGVEPTNNFAEQTIRESVMVRKIIGAFRSESGPKYYERLASLIATWQLQGLDLKTELRQMLIKNLCFC